MLLPLSAPSTTLSRAAGASPSLPCYLCGTTPDYTIQCMKRSRGYLLSLLSFVVLYQCTVGDARGVTTTGRYFLSAPVSLHVSTNGRETGTTAPFLNPLFAFCSHRYALCFAHVHRCFTDLVGPFSAEMRLPGDACNQATTGVEDISRIRHHRLQNIEGLLVPLLVPLPASTLPVPTRQSRNEIPRSMRLCVAQTYTNPKCQV